MGLNVTKFSLGARQMAGSSDRVELQFILRAWSDQSAASYDYDVSSTSLISVDPIYTQVQNYCELRIPTQYDGMDRSKSGIRVEHLRDRKVDDNLGEYFRITVTYTRPEGKRREQNTETQESIASTVSKTVSYNATLETVREYYSKGTVATATGRRPGTGPRGIDTNIDQDRFRNRNGININSETLEPEGTDVGRPVSTMTVEYSANTFVPAEYTNKLDGLIGKQNDTTFEGKAPGEVLFTRYQVTESIEIAAFDPLADYSAGDKVLYLGIAYICLQDAPPGQTPNISPDFWARAVPTNATIIFEFAIKKNVVVTENEWDDDKSFDAGDLVNFYGRVYRAVQGNTNEVPFKNPNNWEYVQDQVFIGRDTKVDPICWQWRNDLFGYLDQDPDPPLKNPNDVEIWASEIKGWDFVHAFYDNEYAYEDAPGGIADADKAGTVPQMGFIERLYTPADLNEIYTIP